MRSATLYRVLAVLLVLIAAALAWNHFGDLNRSARSHPADPAGASGRCRHWHRGRPDGCRRRRAAHSRHRAAVRRRHQDRRQKIAGSLALAISLSTMLVAFARYSRDRSLEVLRATEGFVLAMASGSIIGTILGGLLIGAVPEGVLIPLLVALLLLSSIKVWRHD